MLELHLFFHQHREHFCWASVCQDAGDASPGQVEISCRAAHHARHSQLERPFGDTGMLLPDVPSHLWWKHLSATHTVLGEGAGLLVRWRKCQPSPKSGKQAMKGLTILLKSHMPGGAVSFHPCPWGPACLSPSVSIPPGVMGEGVSGGREIQGQSWPGVLWRGCSLAGSAASVAGGGCHSLGKKAEPKADLHYKRQLSCFCQVLQAPRPCQPRETRSWRQRTKQALAAQG